MKRVTVLIPCYNEAEAIATVITKFPRDKMAAMGFELDVLVIDNNSSDDTAVIARAAGARVITEKKQGKGNAIRTGFYSITENTDYVVMLDGDDTYKPEEIMRLVEPIEAGFAKVIIGSRMEGRMRDGSMKRLNKFGNQLYSQLVRSRYKVKVTDVLTGYYAWSREVIEELRPHLRSQGFAIEMEMVTKMARLGYEIFSVPVSYDPRLGESSLNPVYDGARIMHMYLRNLRWRPEDSEVTGEVRQRARRAVVRKYIKKLGLSRGRTTAPGEDSVRI
ncbi:MAG TPA: glycosyltransferase family 2 protein [Candidatus Saccharimonadales bacterium]|nr:glycosyltransferase family 2 protein [Candidatus Saccharimonadales bacterium]